MPVVPPAKLAQLQSNVHSIRNVCVLAHVDHGKTTLSDALLATNGIISSKLAGKVRYLDSREDEQERGITMESSGISLYYQLLKRATDSTSSDTSLTASEYLVNLIDSPGHVDFASEVASAARLSDGALVLVDVVEGVCTQTVSVLRQAWIENVQPILFLNKMDRLIVEWKMTPSEAYIHMQQLIEQVNAVLAGFWEGDRLAEDSRKLEEAKERWKEAHSEDVAMTEWYLEEKDDSHIYFAPEQGNVLFGSAMDGWAFRVNHFANIFAEKLGIPTPAKLQQLMWGSYYMDPKNKQRVLTNKQLAKLYGPAKAATALPLFVQLCLVPVWQVYESVILEHNQDRIEKVIAALELKVLPRDRRSKDHRVLLTAIMQGWLPLAQACMVAIVEQLPSPAAAQPLRLPPLVQGKTQSLADRKTTEPKNEVERALYSCTAGTTSVPAPLVAYVSKVISVPRESLPEFSSEKSLNNRAAMTAEEMRARGRAAVRQEFALSRDSAAGTPLSAASVAGDTTPNSSGIATPLSVVPPSDISVDSLASAMREKLAVGDTSTEATSDSVNSDPDSTAEEILIGFGRIYSGVVRVGDQIWAMQPKYSAKDANSQSYCKQITVRALYMMMGREFVSLPEVPAGNVFGIRGISGAILKSGTLASDAQTCPNLAAMHSETYPIVRVALEPVNPQDMAKLVRGLELLNQADPCVQVISQATGERVLVTAGELHLERCMKDLRERFAKCEIHVSEPIVPFREGIARQSAQPGVVLGEIGSNGQSLAIIPKAVQGGAEPAEATETRTKPDEGTPRGEVCITTANGLVTITLQVEPLPERTTRFLLRHEDDIRRVARLSSSRRHSRLNAAAEALASVDDSATPLAVAANEASDNDDDGNTNEPRPAKPSRTSELGPWLQGRLRSTFRKAKGWEPQRVEFATDNGLCSFGPRKAGPNMLLYSKEVLEQSSKPKTSWFRRRTHDTALSSTGATPMLSDDEEESDVEEAAAPVATRTAYTIRDFEESVNAGFQLATQSGPLCFEPLVGVAVTIKSLVSNLSGSDSVGTSGLSGQIISAVRDAIKAGFLHWSPRLHLAMYTCDIQATSEVLGKVYGVINRRRGRVLSEEMREGTPYFSIKSAIPIVESFGFADEIRKRTSGAAIPLLIYRGFESLDTDPFWVPTTEEELEDLGEKADRDNVAKRYMDKVRKRKGLFVERKIIEHAEKQRTLKIPEPWVGGDFGHIARKNGLIVDKMLICKTLIDYDVEAICVCLPRRFGKTFNLSIVEEFFNVVTSNDVKPVDGAVDLEAGRAERLKLFEESLLHTTEREFFDEHFCRYPVIRINFKEVTAQSLGTFYKKLAASLHSTLNQWLRRLEGADLDTRAQANDQRVVEDYASIELQLEKTPQHWQLLGSVAINLFVMLSELLHDVYKRQYVVLFDEYDKPLKAIRGQPWEKAAVETYTSLVNKVFKDNNDLRCGLLVGVYKLPLVDIGSGANCVHFLPLTVHGYHSSLNDDSGQPAVLHNSLVDMFAHDGTEVRLLVEAARGRYRRISYYSTEVIMTTLTKWYDGYAFGRTGGKFNPYAVAMFLRGLEHGNIGSATQDYWRLTGNQYMIEELVSENWAEFTRLISRLTWDYDNDDKSKCSVFLTGQQNQTGAPSIRDDAVEVLLGDESPPRNGGSRYTASHIVTLLIHTGYLTIGTGGAVRIPNGELRNMWQRLRLMVSFETDDNEKQNNERTRLFNELYAGDVRGIFDSFQNAYNRLSNDSNTYKEKVLADIVRAHVIGKLDPPRLLHTDGTISSSDHLNRPDYTMEAESGHGKPDWVVKLPPTKENPQSFVIIFEFKQVTSDKNDNANGPLCLARTGLEQIFEREYARSLGEYTRRLDIGVAIGMGKVTMRQRLWSKVGNSPVASLVRQRDDKELLKDSSETVKEWDLRVVSADDAGWRDGMGWQTQSLDPSYRL